MEEAAIEVVERLLGEDDQSVEAWYLGGWGLYLLGQKKARENQEANNEQDGAGHENKTHEDINTASLISSRQWLKQGLTLYEMLEYQDDRLRDHALELVSELDDQLKEHNLDGAEDVDDLVEVHSGDEDEAADSDEEMNGT